MNSQFKDYQKHIYHLFVQHEEEIERWDDKRTTAILNAVFNDGFIDPVCFALFYNFDTMIYRSVAFTLGENGLNVLENKISNLKFLKSIPTFSTDTLIAIKFVSEGTAEIKGTKEKACFLIITTEGFLEGRKIIYTMDKQSFVNPDGSTSIKVSNMKYQSQRSGLKDVPLLEEFAHLIRPNWTDKTDTVYN